MAIVPIKNWKKGDTVYHRNSLKPAKVMAVDGNWIMARFPHCVPWTISFRDATDSYLRAMRSTLPEPKE